MTAVWLKIITTERWLSLNETGVNYSDSEECFTHMYTDGCLMARLGCDFPKRVSQPAAHSGIECLGEQVASEQDWSTDCKPKATLSGWQCEKRCVAGYVDR